MSKSSLTKQMRLPSDRGEVILTRPRYEEGESIMTMLSSDFDRVDESGSAAFEHGFLWFLTMKEARVIRSVCRELRDNVDVTPFFDLESPIDRHLVSLHESLTLWRESFPKAVALNVANRWSPRHPHWCLADEHFVFFRGLRSLDISGSKNISDVAFRHLRGIENLVMHSLESDHLTSAAFRNIRGVESLVLDWQRNPALEAIENRNFQEALRLLESTDGSTWIIAQNRHQRPNLAPWYELLSLSAARGSTDLVRCLLSRGKLVNGRGNSGLPPPLHCACVSGQLETALLLIEWGADLNARDRQGHTPLRFARWSHSAQTEALVEALLSRGAVM